MSHREANAGSRMMHLPHLQATQITAARKSTSPDREHCRKMSQRDRQCTDNSEGRFTPVVSRQDMSAAVDVCLAEAESADVSMRLGKKIYI